MSQIIESLYLSSNARDPLPEYASSMFSFSSGYGYMTPPSSATSRRHSMVTPGDSPEHFLTGSLSTSDSGSFSELQSLTLSTSASSSRNHSTGYNTFQLHPVSDSPNDSPNDSQQYTEPRTPQFVVPDAFPHDLKSIALNEGLPMTMTGIFNDLSTRSASQDIQEGHISMYDPGTSISIEGILGFDPIADLENSFPSSEIDYAQNSTGVPSSNSTNWPTHLAPETVVPAHTFMFSSPPGSPSAHRLGSPIKLEPLPPQRASFDFLSAHNEIPPGSSPTMPEHTTLDIAAAPTPRNRGLGRLRKVGRISGWRPGNKTALHFPMCDIRKIEKIETNPCLPCTAALGKRVAFKRPEHLKRHLITDQHTKNAMKDAADKGIECPFPIEKPVYPCLIPNCKKGLDRAPFVGRRDNLTQHYKNTHFHDKHKNGGGKNDWISVERAEELGLASKDPRNKEKYEG